MCSFWIETLNCCQSCQNFVVCSTICEAKCVFTQVLAICDFRPAYPQQPTLCVPLVVVQLPPLSTLCSINFQPQPNLPFTNLNLSRHQDTTKNDNRFFRQIQLIKMKWQKYLRTRFIRQIIISVENYQIKFHHPASGEVSFSAFPHDKKRKKSSW